MGVTPFWTGEGKTINSVEEMIMRSALMTVAAIIFCANLGVAIAV